MSNPEFRPAVIDGRTPPPEPERRSLFTNLDPTEIRVIEWLWSERAPLGQQYRMIPRRKATMLSGRGGIGKSTFAIWLALREVRDGGKVAYISLEDTGPDILTPRFKAAGASDDEISQVLILATGQSFRLPKDQDVLRGELDAEEDITLVIVDPSTSFLEGSRNEGDDVRAFISCLTSLSEELDLTVVGILHERKGTDGSSLDAVSGSHEWRNASRQMLAFDVWDDTDLSAGGIITVVKGNYARKVSFTFKCEEVQVAIPAASGASVLEPFTKFVLGEATDESTDDIRRERRKAEAATDDPYEGVAEAAYEFFTSTNAGGFWEVAKIVEHLKSKHADWTGLTAQKAGKLLRADGRFEAKQPRGCGRGFELKPEARP